MGRIKIVAALLAIVLPGAMRSAHADVLYNFTYTVTTELGIGGGSDYSGVFDVSGGEIVGITGTSSLYGTINALLPPGSYPPLGASNDNLFSPTAPYLDIWTKPAYRSSPALGM
jgi:hypothetical protein